MTRNRADTEAPGTSADPGTPPADHGPWASRIGVLLTLVLLAPAAALLSARVRELVRIEQSGLPGCTGTQALGPVLQAGAPVVLLLLVIPGALLSLGHRARGWIALLLALAATLALEVALRLWWPGCL